MYVREKQSPCASVSLGVIRGYGRSAHELELASRDPVRPVHITICRTRGRERKLPGLHCSEWGPCGSVRA